MSTCSRERRIHSHRVKTEDSVRLKMLKQFGIGAANLKAFVAVGSKQYHKLQLAGNSKDVETVMQPENVVELENTLESATTFGMSFIMEDIRLLFTDYSEGIAQSSCKVSIIHSEMDPMFPIEAMRELQADYSGRIKLIEFEDAGFTVLLSHTEEVVNLLSDIINDIDIWPTGKRYKTPKGICKLSI